MIPVTRPFLPPLGEMTALIESIWSSQWLTNHGPLATRLEEELKDYFRVPDLKFVTNGTVALQLAIRALDLKGKVITSPFSYVATTSSLVWEHCRPVFADIDAATFNIDPERVEAVIDEETTGILATHCFGNPCDIAALERIARDHNLALIFDAAHCFGTSYRGRSVLNYGDLSTISFHATKPFHTAEGGAIVTARPELAERVYYLRNFGHEGYEAFRGVGINGKNSELHAAMGLCVLKYVSAILASRKEQSLYYKELLAGKQLKYQRIQPDTGYNHAYFPVLFMNEGQLKEAKARLEQRSVFPRRYFFPSLSGLDYVMPQATPVADDIARRILCLPLYSGLTREEQALIASLL